MAKNMWNIPSVKSLRTPLSVMREQGDALSEASGGALLGSAQAAGAGSMLIIDFRIIVRALNHYNYGLFRYEQPVISLYPGTFTSFVDGKATRVSSIEEFERSFFDLVNSDQVKLVLVNLTAQAAAMDA